MKFHIFLSYKYQLELNLSSKLNLKYIGFHSARRFPLDHMEPRSTEKSLVILKLSKNDCVVLGNSVLVYNC